MHGYVHLHSLIHNDLWKQTTCGEKFYGVFEAKFEDLYIHMFVCNDSGRKPRVTVYNRFDCIILLCHVKHINHVEPSTSM